MTVTETRLSESDVIKNAVRLTSLTHKTFSADDVWDVLPIQPSNRGQVGAAFNALSAAGEIAPTGYSVLSQRPGTNSHAILEWKKAKPFKA